MTAHPLPSLWDEAVRSAKAAVQLYFEPLVRLRRWLKTWLRTMSDPVGVLADASDPSATRAAIPIAIVERLSTLVHHCIWILAILAMRTAWYELSWLTTSAPASHEIRLRHAEGGVSELLMAALVLAVLAEWLAEWLVGRVVQGHHVSSPKTDVSTAESERLGSRHVQKGH